MTSTNHNQYTDRAKQLVADRYNSMPRQNSGDITPEDVYVVWFAKTLQNWKALLSTDIPDGRYYEVTYNGDKHEAYVDTYGKIDNVAVKDAP